MHDVPRQLEEMGVALSVGLANLEEVSDAELIGKFLMLPKLFSGRQITVEFVMSGVWAAWYEDCETLDLELGATVSSNVTLSKSDHSFTIYGEGEMAFILLSLTAGSVVSARVKTAFGARKRVEWCDDGPIATKIAETGLVVKEILRSEPPNS